MIKMSSDDNNNNHQRVCLIQDFRPRLRKLIQVDPVLDRMHSMDPEVKEQIRIKARAEGGPQAADLLVDAVLREPHHDGWFREFVDALDAGGCEHAADYVEQARFPNPTVEAENDYCVRLLELLSPSLLDMKTQDVCFLCFTKGILTHEDREIISADKTNNGNRNGARELLKRIVRNRPGWYSTFLMVLKETEHLMLYRDLTGESPAPTGDGEVLPPLTDVSEPTGSDVGSEAGPAGTEGSVVPEKETEVSGPVQIMDETTDLYNEEERTAGPVPHSQSLSVPDGMGTTAAVAGGLEKADIVLRDYQMDVAGPALEGKNVIVCLPTGSGKTRVAVYITKAHLDSRRREGHKGKVIVLVNKVPLVEQLFSTEFRHFLKPHDYKVERVSGDSQHKISFSQIVQRNDVVVCTAQLLQNHLELATGGEDEGIRLADLTLLVIDECHHTQKGDVYNHIMMRYLKQKHKNARLRKEHKEEVPIPQVLGLTASPGVGGATKMEKAEDHILRICANLDASKIMTRSLGEFKKEPYKRIATVEERKQDPFGDVIKRIMNDIQVHADLNPTCDLGSQNYEQWVVQKEQNAAKEENQKVRVCAEHLRMYNEGLQLSNTIRMCDAFSFLSRYQEEEMRRKVAPEEEESIQITDTERFLFHLFRGNRDQLNDLAKNPDFENRSLSELRTIILREFTSRDEARGIIFTKTRRSAIALSQWVQENPKFEEVGVKACYVIGGGDQSVVKPMTSAEQRDVLNKFRNGEVNLLIATTVAEEGLDIAECNVVIRYGLVTNEIAMIQARGRGRAEDSTYTLVEVEGSGVAEKESVNEYREKMMSKAIEKVKNMDTALYEKRIEEFQIQAIMEEKVRMMKTRQKGMKKLSPSDVTFSCRGCNKHVCTGDDIEIIARMHRVNVSAQFRELFIQTANTSLKERLLDYETNGFIKCKGCGQRWGSMMFYRGIECPCVNVKHFVVTSNGKKSKCTKWDELKIQLPAFDYAAHASLVVESSEDEDGE